MSIDNKKIEEYRIKGNKILTEYKKKKFKDKDFFEQELLNAVFFYEEGLKLCNNDSYYDIYKLTKNITLAYEILINYNLDQHSDIFFVKHHRYTKKLFYYYSNLLYYMAHLDKEIYNEIINKINNSSKYFIEFKDEDKLGLINEIIEPFAKTNKYLYYHFSSEVCNNYFHKGLEYYNKNDTIKSIHYFYSAIDYFKQNNVFNDFQLINKEINDILLSCSFYIKRIKVKKLLDSAIKDLDTSIFQSEKLDVDLTKIALDNFRSIYNEIIQNDKLENKSVDIEYEAICLSYIVKIRYSILKSYELESIFLLANQSVKLAESLMPRNLNNEKWFNDVSNILQEIRDRKQKEEEEKDKEVKNNMDQNIFKKIGEEFDKGKLNFINFILKEYKDENNSKIDYNTIKDNYLDDKKFTKNLKELIKCYHPDKCPKNTLKEKEKYWIYHEITARLNRIYSEYKC